MDEDEAERIQRNFYKEHGTTLRGLMLTRNINPDEFLEFVHDIDHSVVKPDPALGEALLRLPGKKYIFTNGSRQHAEKVAARLGFPTHFTDIFDIVAANLVPKPERETYDRFVSHFGAGAGARRDVRGPDAQSRRAEGGRDDHRPRRAGGHARGVPRRVGVRGARRRPCRLRDG